MSSNRKKIIEPWEIVRETCGRGTKIAMFACFCPSKKPLFSLFRQILPFPAKIKKNKKMPILVSTNPIFCAQGLPNWWKKSTLTRAGTNRQKKQRPFSLVWWRHQTEWNQTSPVCSPMWTFFCRNDFLNRFIRSRDIVSKLLSPPTVQLYKRHFQCLNNQLEKSNLTQVTR